MNTSYRCLVAALSFLCCMNVFAAAYPTEDQLRTAIEDVSGLLKVEGLDLTILDGQKEGVAYPLMAAGLNLGSGVCLVFYSTKPTDGLNQFFDSVDEKELPVWLKAIAVHEATHCIEQREAYIHKHFDKVLPRDVKRDNMTVQGYLSVVKSGAVETWGETLADIASVLYLKQAVPDDWRRFAMGIAAMRHDLSVKWPAHDTSASLYKLIAANAEKEPDQSIFEAAFQLRRQLQSE
jgi:hypothetical protein